MVGQDVAFSGTCCALHGMTNTVLLMLMTWVPFGDSGKLAYEAHLTATSAATLVWVLYMLAVSYKSSYAAMGTMLCCIVSFLCHCFAIVIFAIALAACGSNPERDGGLTWTGAKPAGYVYAGPRVEFIAYYCILCLSLLGDVVIGWLTYPVVNTFRIMKMD